MTMPQVEIYTDGACKGNPGPGGYAAILVAGSREKTISGGYRLTTNNRMEILAVIAGLSALKRPAAVTLYTDSQYVGEAIRKGWAARWRKNGWRKADKSPALNADLWAQLLDLLEEHEVTVEWVRGHAGHERNEAADRLAVAAASAPNLPADPGYPAK